MLQRYDPKLLSDAKAVRGMHKTLSSEVHVSRPLLTRQVLSLPQWFPRPLQLCYTLPDEADTAKLHEFSLIPNQVVTQNTVTNA